MKVTPTSGPMPSSSSHQEREASSSRHSFSSSHRKGAFREGVLCKSKKHLFQILAVAVCQRRELRHRAFAADAPAAEQHEAVAEARGVCNLVNGEKHRAAASRMRANCGGDLARL